MVVGDTTPEGEGTMGKEDKDFRRDMHYNDLNVHPSYKVTPDLLQNLEPKYQVPDKNFEKQIFDRVDECDSGVPIPMVYPTKAPGQYVGVDNGRKGDRKKKRKQNIVRGLCFLGWICCCPLMTAGVLIRETPVDPEDFEDDVCMPCFVKE